MNKLRKKVSFLLLISLLSLNFSYTSFADDSQKVTKEEIVTVESEVVKLQSNLFNSSKSNIEILLQDFKKLSSYEEKGNSKFDFSFDEDTFFGSGSGYFNLDNYSVKSSIFDVEMSGDIDSKAVYNPLSGTGLEFDLKGFASMISKDSDLYVLLKDLNFNVNDENVSKVLETIKGMFKNEKYVKFPANEESKIFFNYLKGFDLNNFFNETEEILKSPLLTTYKKDGDKYLLVPTKYACETYFNLESKFNLGIGNSFFTPKTCSDTVYKAFLGEFVKSGNFYLTLGSNFNVLGFEGKEDDTEIKFSINYNDISILKFLVNVTPNQKKYPGEGFTFDYFKNNHLKSTFNVDNGTVKVNFDGKLDNNNNFSEISSNYVFGKDVSGEFNLKNKKYAGVFYARQKGYDYSDDDFKYVLKNVYGGKISGTLNDDNSLNTLNLKVAGVSIQDKKTFLLSNLDIFGNDINFSLKYDDEYEKFNIASTGKYDKNYFKLDSTYDVYSYYRTYNGKLNFEFDMQDNKNNGIMNFELNNDEKNLLKFNFRNDALREYNDEIKVESPTDFEELNPEDFHDILYPEYEY